MSFRANLKHRCNILRLSETQVDGLTSHLWNTVTGGGSVRCFLDLNFIRKGKDAVWTPEAGRPSDRSGVLFLLGNAPIKSGDRIEMLYGPKGTFEIQGAIDEAWTPRKLHHLEIGVLEVGSPIAKGSPK